MLREKNSFSQTTFSSVAPRLGTTITPSHCDVRWCPTARSTQSRCGSVMPWKSAPTDRVRWTSVQWLLARHRRRRRPARAGRGVGSVGRTGTAARRDRRDHRPRRDLTVRMCGPADATRCESASVSAAAGTPISVEYGSTAGNATATIAAGRRKRGRGHSRVDPERAAPPRRAGEVEHVPLLDPRWWIDANARPRAPTRTTTHDGRDEGAVVTRAPRIAASTIIAANGMTRGEDRARRRGTASQRDTPDDGVGRGARDLVRAEDAEDRRAARELDDDDQQHRARPGDEEPAELAQRAPS